MRVPVDRKSEAQKPGGVEPLRRKRVVPATPSGMPRRSIHLLLIFVTVVLVVDALVGEKGLMESMRARQQSREVAASLEAIKRENVQLLEEARRLREDPQAIEALARKDLGLIRQGELLFIIKDDKPRR